MNTNWNVSYFTVVALVAVSAIFCAFSPNNAQAGDDYDSGQNYYATLGCGQLWYERNRIFAEHGYCFKSQRAINTFGPACFPPYGKLPSNLKGVVKEIKSWERRRGC